VGITGWIVVRLASRHLWLPGELSDRLGLFAASLRVVAPSETLWEPDALIPTGPWRRLQAAPASSPQETVRFRTDQDVALVRLPRAMAHMAPERRLRSLGHLDRYLGIDEDIPDLETLTINPYSAQLIGLHLDNWDRLPIGMRHASRNRASVNLGPVPRALLFVDLDIAAGYRADAIPDTETTRKRLLTEQPPPAVLRLLVPPGWAYIAPTENLLHDGSSSTYRQSASHTSALGQFRPVRGPVRATVVSVAL
jgi:hypothetical protein